MSLSKLFAATLVAVGLSIAAATPARAALVTWDVDAAQSYGRITIPDFNYDTGVIGVINVRPRNYNVNTNAAWTDAGGRSRSTARSRPTWSTASAFNSSRG